MRTLGFAWRKLSTQIYKTKTLSQKIVKVAFSDKYLFYTNITISITLSSVGDTLEQQYEIYKGDLKSYDGKRSANMAFSGLAVGILCHHWYKVLDRFIIGKSLPMVTKKLFLDQFIFSPVMIVTFFGSLALLEKNPLQNFKTEVKDKFIRLYKAEWMVWPPAQIINFYFLPTKYRVLYDNIISLGYDVYTSQVKHDKPQNLELVDSKHEKKHNKIKLRA